jgi:hypothetical protein
VPAVLLNVCANVDGEGSTARSLPPVMSCFATLADQLHVEQGAASGNLHDLSCVHRRLELGPSPSIAIAGDLLKRALRL